MDLNDNSLLHGCYVEALRSDDISLKFEGLRIAINEPSNSHLAAIITEIRRGGRRLRELADLAQVHRDRVPFVLTPLNIVLPCLSRSLRDMQRFYEDRTQSTMNRWRDMYHKMGKETGVPLITRFITYNSYIGLLKNIIARCPSVDMMSVESLSCQILRLREARRIGPPVVVQPGPLVRHSGRVHELDPAPHWAEYIFFPPLPSRTAFPNVGQSISLGPHLELGSHVIPSNSKVLFRRTFENDALSLTVFINSRDRGTYLLTRIINEEKSWFALQGAHELCIERVGTSLHLRRWSTTENCSKAWAILGFKTWEELVLLKCTFLALKAQNNLTVQVDSVELRLNGERMLFQARINDDGFDHSLIICQDKTTGGIRLHSAVWDGELRQCPVWTAFVTHQAASPSWIKRVSHHKIRLADVQLHVFCKQYRQQTQRRGPAGAFQLDFVSDHAARAFEDVFYSMRLQQ